MFDIYDDKDKCYKISFQDGTEKDVTCQELYEFYVFSVDMTDQFEKVKSRLDHGEVILVKQYEYDFFVNSSVYKDTVTLSRKKTTSNLTDLKKAVQSNSDCLHPKAYINQAGGKKFRVCPECKKDLGDA